MIDDPLALPPLLQAELIAEAHAQQQVGASAQPATFPLLADEARRAGVSMHEYGQRVVAALADIKARWIARA